MGCAAPICRSKYTAAGYDSALYLIIEWWHCAIIAKSEVGCSCENLLLNEDASKTSESFENISLHHFESSVAKTNNTFVDLVLYFCRKTSMAALKY